MVSTTNDKIRDIIMDAVIVVAVAAQMYFVLDEMTDGRFSREMSVKYTKALGRIQEEIKRERFFKKNVGRYIWDAITIVETDRQGTPGNGDREDDVDTGGD